MATVKKLVTREEFVHICDFCSDQNDAIRGTCSWCGKNFCERHGTVVAGEANAFLTFGDTVYPYISVCCDGHISDPPASWAEIEDILKHLRFQRVVPV